MARVDETVEQLTYHQRIRLPFRYTAGEAEMSFLRGLEDGVILGSRCTACELVLVPARPFCPTCSGATGERIEVAPEGAIVSYTTEADGRVIGLIRLDGTDTHFPHVVDGSRVAIGMRVRARWAADRSPEIAAVEAFEPA